MKLIFFEYLGKDATVATFMKSPASRFSNIMRILAEVYGVKVIKVYTNVKEHFVHNIIDFLVTLGTLIIRLTVGSLKDGEVIFTVPGRSWLAGFLMKLIRPSIIWIADVNDTGENEVVTDMLKNQRPYQYHILKLFKRTILMKTDFIVGTNYCVDQILENGYPNNKAIFLQDGVNIESFMRGDGTRTRRRLNLIGKKIILYDGKLLYHYKIEKLIFAFAEVKQKIHEAVLLIVGDGPALLSLKEIASMLSLGDSVVFLGLQPYSVMPDIVMSADVCVLPFATVGLQVWEWLAVGKVVVAIRSENLEEHGLSHLKNCVFVDSSNDLSAGIEFALNNENNLSHLSSNAISFAKKLDWKILVSSLYSVLIAKINKKGENCL